MLYADTTSPMEPRPMIAGRPMPIHVELPALDRVQERDVELETAAMLEALAQGRDSDERAIDFVVDRLLGELT